MSRALRVRPLATADIDHATLFVGDPLTMPPELFRAHQALDRAVDAAYGKKSFASEAARVAFLFGRYQALTSMLPGTDGSRRLRKQSLQSALTYSLKVRRCCVLPMWCPSARHGRV